MRLWKLIDGKFLRQLLHHLLHRFPRPKNGAKAGPFSAPFFAPSSAPFSTPKDGAKAGPFSATFSSPFSAPFSAPSYKWHYEQLFCPPSFAPIYAIYFNVYRNDALGHLGIPRLRHVRLGLKQNQYV